MREPIVLTEPSPALVRFPAEVDIACAGDLRDRMLALLNRGAAVLVADLRTTVFCDCAGLNALLRAQIRARALGSPFGILIFPTAPAWKVFRLTGAADAIPHAPTLAELTPLLRARP